MALSVVMFYGTVDARDYPTRPVRILTSPVGGSTDLIARLIAQSLTSSLGQQVIVDNRPTGIIPGEIVVKAPADGYTMLFHGSSLWMMQFLQKVPFDPVNDLVPVTLATSTPTIVVLNPTVPATTIKELIHEEFGDGIMSAIDFSMDIQREPHAKGDRVRVILSGKFLPYKVY